MILRRHDSCFSCGCGCHRRDLSFPSAWPFSFSCSRLALRFCCSFSVRSSSLSAHLYLLFNLNPHSHLVYEYMKLSDSVQASFSTIFLSSLMSLAFTSCLRLWRALFESQMYSSGYMYPLYSNVLLYAYVRVCTRTKYLLLLVPVQYEYA